MTAHLQLMSKPRLIHIIGALEKRAQAHAELADYWRGVTNGLIDTAPKPAHLPSPETTWAEARRILRGLPVDPHAQEHRDELRAALNMGGRAVDPAKPTCGRATRAGRCGRALNGHGFCPHHDSTATKRAEARSNA